MRQLQLTKLLHKTSAEGVKIARKISKWTPQQKRMFSRITSGLRKHKGEILRFLTLTTTDYMGLVYQDLCYIHNFVFYFLMKRITKPRTLEQSFKVLKERIRRCKLANYVGYPVKRKIITEANFEYYFPGRLGHQTVRFEYWKVRTNEGRSGVIHVLYFGDLIPQRWIKEQWLDITGSAWIVDIRATNKKVTNTKRLAMYCINQYVIQQTKNVNGISVDAKMFQSQSWGWVVRGFTVLFKNLCRDLNYDFKRVRRIWNHWMDVKQFYLTDKEIKIIQKGVPGFFRKVEKIYKLRDPAGKFLGRKVYQNTPMKIFYRSQNVQTRLDISGNKIKSEKKVYQKIPLDKPIHYWYTKQLK